MTKISPRMTPKPIVKPLAPNIDYWMLSKPGSMPLTTPEMT